MVLLNLLRIFFEDYPACVSDMLLFQLPDYPAYTSLTTEDSCHLLCDVASLVSGFQRLERTYCFHFLG